ncbi:ATP-binding protein [Streptomyces sp. CNQ-509]|uniref:SCO6881 family protein n=1 Tax=Streptomyces sp. CNQ-509 TaxID=444103 RepID=UPI00062DE281|nr:ATP-binding protein [Streptomyces sp. CNQ-509]AKH83932.1 ATP-binding protein [Streptomyces sp. CNQ-509]
MPFCDVPVVGRLCDVDDAVDFVSDPGKAIGDWMAESAGELAVAAVDLAAEGVDTTTKVDLNAGWFRDNYETLLPLGLVMLVATFCAQLVRAAIRRDGQALTQAFTGTAAGVLFAVCAIAVTTVAVEVVDALSAGLLKSADMSIESAVRRTVKVQMIASVSPLGWLVSVVAGLGAALGAFLYWGVMMVRKVGILVMVTLAIFAAAGGGWEVARRWRKGWIEATATLIVSKLLMTVIFVLGISAMGRSDAKDGAAALADVMAGIVIMAMVLLAPYAVFKFVHWAADTDSESLHRAGGTGAQIARAHGEKAARKAAAAATAGAGGGAAAGSQTGAASPGGEAAGAGGFPGDIAANPTGGTGKEAQPGRNAGGTSSSGGKPSLDEALQPAPTSVSDDTSGQIGGTPGPSAPPSSGGSGTGSGWQSAPPTTSPPPQRTPPAGAHHAPADGTAEPPSPAGP